ncbi:RnfH family protein [Massilia sp. S19_KUP03_FR1]|uniref:RnfH family protein n=1 Tax=Massilia sp. S19_KUP03_FR1 TaxID=3025503 RepID=UPI002FCD99C3
MGDAAFDVIVAWATPGQALLRPVQVVPGNTIAQAIAASGVLADLPEIDLAVCPVGIYGKKKPLDTLVRPLDRIEIYRPLVADPKESRRRRAAHKSAQTG